MDEKLKRLLQEDMEKEADKIMEEVNKDPDLANVTAPDDIRERVFAQIREYEIQKAYEKTAEDKELIRLGKVYKRRRKWNRYIILAAAMVLAMAYGVTSIGGPEKVFEEVRWLLGGKEQTNIDTDDERIVEPDDMSEAEAYEKIEEEFGFYPVKLNYLPEGMGFAGALIEEETQSIQLLYEKENKVGVYYFIQPNYRVSSIGREVEENLLSEYTMDKGEVAVHVKRYEVDKNRETRWMVSFEYNGIHYLLKVLDLEENEVKKIVENLYFS